jgi:hypothetical protein
MTTTPVPIGVDTTFANLAAGQATRNFTPTLATADQGGPASQVCVVGFQALDPNNPGVLTLYDSGGNVIVALNTEGYETFQPIAGMSYYFNSTLGAAQVSCISPSIWR